MKRQWLMMVALLAIILLAACGGDDEPETLPDDETFATPLPPPSPTPAPTDVVEDIQLTNNFSRIDDAVRIRYPDGWLVDTSGDETVGELLLGNTRQAQRGEPGRNDLSMQFVWSPADQLAEVVPEASPDMVLEAVLSTWDESGVEFEEPYTLVIGERRTARVDGADEDGLQVVLFITDFGDGVMGYYTFRTQGTVADFEPLITALIESTRYGGPPAIVNTTENIPPILSLDHDGFGVRGLLWSADDTRMLSWAEDGRVRLWDLASGDQLMRFDHDARVIQVAWIVNETRLVTLAEGQSLAYWDVESGDLLQSLAVLGTVQSFSVAPNEQLVAGVNINFSTNVSTVPVWNLETGELILTARPGRGTAWGAAWNSGSTKLVVHGTQERAGLWDVEAGERLLSFSHTGAVVGAQWNSDDTQVLTWSQDLRVRVWDPQTGEPVLTIVMGGSPRGATWNQDSSRVLAWQIDKDGRLVDVASGDILQTFETRPATGGIGWNTSETRLISWTTDGVSTPLARLWDAETSELLQSFPGQFIMGTAAWNARETRLVTFGSDGQITVWNAESGETAVTFTHAGIGGIYWDHTGARLASWSRDGLVHIWQT